jgi:hypothetical protein
LIGSHSAGPGTPIVYNTNNVVTVNFAFPGVAAQPVTGDVYGTGIDDLGLWVPSASGNASTGGQFYFLSPVNSATYAPGTPVAVSALNHAFSATPLGNDMYVQFGTNAALPLVGIWDPPTSSVGGGNVVPTATSLGTVQGPLVTAAGSNWISVTPARTGNLEVSVGAVNGGQVQASLYDTNYNLLGTGTVDANGNLTFAATANVGQTYLIRLTGLAAGTSGSVATISNVVPLVERLDVLQQGNVTPQDALAIINYLNLNGSGSVSSTSPNLYFDANMDGKITPADALAVIDYLNTSPGASSVSPQVTSDDSTSSVVSVTPQVAVALDNSPSISAAAVTSPTPAVTSAAVTTPTIPGTGISSAAADAAVVAAFQQSSSAATPTAVAALPSSAQSNAAGSGSSASGAGSEVNGAAVDAALGDSSDWLN